MKYLVLLFVCILGISQMQSTLADECPQVCTMEYNPLCVKDVSGETHTFANPCELRSKTCNEPHKGYTLVKLGEC
nr:turripeptide Pal9.2-like [Onthophagus taurus]